MCREKMVNKHMGLFYSNLISLRESTRYRYQDCIVDAGNSMEGVVLCVRDYLSGVDKDNVQLKSLVEEKCSSYY